MTKKEPYCKYCALTEKEHYFGVCPTTQFRRFSPISEDKEDYDAQKNYEKITGNKCNKKFKKEKVLGCRRYLGTAFDNPYMKVYCGDEIYGGETRGLFIKYCESCQSKKDNQTPKEDTNEEEINILSSVSKSRMVNSNKTFQGDNWTLDNQRSKLYGEILNNIYQDCSCIEVVSKYEERIKEQDKLFLKKLKEKIRNVISGDIYDGRIDGDIEGDIKNLIDNIAGAGLSSEDGIDNGN